MTAQFQTHVPNESEVEQAVFILRELSQNDCKIICKPDLEYAAIMKGNAEKDIDQKSKPIRRHIVDKFYVQNILKIASQGQIFLYELTDKGFELAKTVEAGNLETIKTIFRTNTPPQKIEKIPPRKISYENTETPIHILARKRDKHGKKYLTPRLVAAAERLREDFEIGEIDQQVTQNWDEFLKEWASEPFEIGSGTTSTREAKARWASAMQDLGVGLNDIAFRVCCNQEGLETAEAFLGWSARSGKIVLRIALIHLAEFYQIPDNSLV